MNVSCIFICQSIGETAQRQFLRVSVITFQNITEVTIVAKHFFIWRDSIDSTFSEPPQADIIDGDSFIDRFHFGAHKNLGVNLKIAE